MAGEHRIRCPVCGKVIKHRIEATVTRLMAEHMRIKHPEVRE